MTQALLNLRPALERALANLPARETLPAELTETLDRARARLTRDLLPRMEGEHPTLLVGIAGPNNVGKSSLFNALVGQQLSPAKPEGGLTKQCFAAAHPSLWESGLRGVLERRFEIVRVAQGELPPVTEPGPPGRLYLALTEALPPGLLVMDTPDFDSVYRENRRAAEALLVTVDVVLFVVSRHTYQNAALVDFLRTAIGHGRPYGLIYNEATREEVARSHLATLEEQAGHPAVARFLAPHQPAVEGGSALLETTPLEGAALSVLLRAPEHVARLKTRALTAALLDCIAELETLAQASAATAAEPERLRARLRRELAAVGARAAGLAIPADVLIEAFRDELDARSTGHRWLRKGPRLVSGAVLKFGRFMREQLVGTDPRPPPVKLQVDAALQDGVREVVEALAPEVATWKGDERTGELLRARLGPTSLASLKSLPSGDAADTDADRAELYRFCRELLSREMRGGVTEQLQQLGATIAYAVPAFVGVIGAVTVPGVTGGADVVFASTLLTTPLLERFVDQLGAGVRLQLAQNWRRSHGATLARQLEETYFSDLLVRLDALVEEARRTSSELGRAAEQVRASAAEVA